MKTKKLDQKLGSMFKEGRLNAGFSQSSVSKLLGYSSPQFLSNFERGLCSMPLPKLRQLIELYRLDGQEVVEIIMDLQSKYLETELLRPNKKGKVV